MCLGGGHASQICLIAYTVLLPAANPSLTQAMADPAQVQLANDQAVQAYLAELNNMLLLGRHSKQLNMCMYKGQAIRFEQSLWFVARIQE